MMNSRTNQLAMCIMFAISSLYIHSQDYSSVISPEYEERLIPDNPNISSLGNYGFNPVDKYTGTANISIPIYQIDLDGLTIPLVASYNTRGNKVAQEASWIGLGWNLGAGCFITNEINGFDDTKNSTAPTISQPKGYVFSKNYLTRNPPTYNLEITQDDVNELVSKNQIGVPQDTEPDIFTANLFGKQVRFVLEKVVQGDTTTNGKVVGSKNIKVDYNVNTAEFTITDENGFRYHFNRVEYTTPYVFHAETYDSSFTEERHIRLIHDYTKDFNQHDILQDKVSWQITKVVSPFENELFFEYQRTLSISYPTISEQFDYRVNHLTSSSVGPNPYVYEIGSYSSDHSARYYIFENVVLKKIYGDFGSVDFLLDEREDLFSETSYANFVAQMNVPPFSIYKIQPQSTESPKRLSAIEVKNPSGTKVKNIVFHQSYFNLNKQNDINKERFLRLKLDSLEIEDKKYEFGYIQPNSLASKISKDTDFWGFYNGAGNSDRIPRYGRFNASYSYQAGYEYFVSYDRGNTRKSDFSYAKIGLLNSVKYPTGASTEYLYEANTASVLKPQPYNPHYDSNGNFKSSSVSSSQDYQWNYQYLKNANDPTYSFANYGLNCDVNSNSIGNNQEFTINEAQICNEDYNVSISATISCSVGCGIGINPTGPATWIRNLDTGQVQNIFSFDGHSPNNGQNWSVTLQQNLSLPTGNYRFEYDPAWSNSSPTVVATNNSNLILLTQEILNPGTASESYEEFEVGGARIHKIFEKDYNGSILSVRKFTYQEVKPNGLAQSSGVLMNQLIFHSKNNGFFEYTPEHYYGNRINLHSDNILRGRNSASGSHLGYSTVTETKVSAENQSLDNGKVITTYINEPNEPVTRFIGNTTAYKDSGPTISYGKVFLNGALPKSFGYKNGSLLEKQILASDGNLKKSNKFEYGLFSTTSHINDAYPHISYQLYVLPGNCPVDICGFFPELPYYKEMKQSDVNENYFNLLKKVTDSVIFDTENLVTRTEYFYENTQHYLPTSISSLNSKGELYTDKNYYPQDLPLEPSIGYLIDLNRMNIPISHESYLGTPQNPEDFLLKRKKINYGKDTTTKGWVLPKSVSVKKGEMIEELRTTYEEYDDKGNLLELKLENGISISYVWGYNQEYPVAKIENATYAQVEGVLDANLNLGLGGLTSVQASNLRSGLPNAMVTTYTYEPLIGLKSVTDSRGNTMTYFYDEFNRLKEIKDASGNLVTDYRYHYKSQP